MIKVRAHSNIALIKYWGKRSQNLKTPLNNSISMTLDQLYTETELCYKPELSADRLFLNGERALPAMEQRVQGFMNVLRQSLGFSAFAEIHSTNFFPTGAGLASSASAFAALTLAAVKGQGQDLSTEVLSRLARQGSGSACRSLLGGFVEWQAGQREDGLDSFAVSLPSSSPHTSPWKPIMVVLVLTSAHKAIGSGDGMQRTVDTSPLYASWLDSVAVDLSDMRAGIRDQDFEKVGELMEHNALKMHATALAARPSVLYWEPASVALIHHIQGLRQEGVPCYLTMDAGPNVKVLLPPVSPSLSAAQQVQYIQQIIEHPAVTQHFVCQPGPEAQVIAL